MKSWWIDEPMVLGSSNPTTNQLKELYLEGFRSIISLLDEEKQLLKYDTEKVKAIGFKWYPIPLKDFSAPTLDKFQVFFERVHQALGQGKVLVHCHGGSGRTGTMAAAYWVNKGLSAKEAIQKIRESNQSAIETNGQVNSLYELEKKPIEAVCFDFKGVIVNHENYENLIPGIDKLLTRLKEKRLRLAVVSSFPSQSVSNCLGPLHEHFDSNIFSGSGDGKLDRIREFAGKYGISDLSKIAFVDDKPANIVPVAERSKVYVIAFRGSGKYPSTCDACKEKGIPFAETIEDLRKLLFM